MRPDEIIPAINAFTQRYPNAEWGPGHIVLSDYNLDDSFINFCLSMIDAVLAGGTDNPDLRHNLDKLDWYKSHDIDEIRATREFLLWLLSIPEEVRDQVFDED